MARAAPIAVLLLPHKLERLALREPVEEVLRGPGVVGVEPGGLSYETMGRLPELLAERFAAGQARRLARGLPGRPVAVVVFAALQWPLAQGLLARAPGCELLVVLGDAPAPDARPELRERAVRYADAAAGAAAAVYAPDELPARLPPRLRELGVATA